MEIKRIGKGKMQKTLAHTSMQFFYWFLYGEEDLAANRVTLLIHIATRQGRYAWPLHPGTIGLCVLLLFRGKRD